MSTTCVNRAIAPRPVPRPNSAVTIGSPIAMSEPNVSSSTTIAASRPTAVERPKPACSVGLDRLAAQLDLEARPRRPRARPHDAFGGARGQQVGFLVEHDRRERDLAVGRDRPARRRARVGADHGRRRAAALRPRANIALMCERTAGSLTLPELDLEDDRVAVAGLRGEAALQQVGGALRVGVGQREVVGVVGAGRLGERVDADAAARSTRSRRTCDGWSTSGRA